MRPFWLYLAFSLSGSQSQPAATAVPATTIHDSSLRLSYGYPSTFADASAVATSALQTTLPSGSAAAYGGKCIALHLARIAPTTEEFGMILIVRTDAVCLKRRFNAGSAMELARGEALGLSAVGAKPSFTPSVPFKIADRPAAFVEGSFSLPAGQTMRAMVVCVLDQPDVACWQFLAPSVQRLHALASLPVTFDGSSEESLLPPASAQQP